MKQLLEAQIMMNNVKNYSSLMKKEHSLCNEAISLQHSLAELEGNTSLVEVASVKAKLIHLYKELSEIQGKLNLLEQAI